MQWRFSGLAFIVSWGLFFSLSAAAQEGEAGWSAEGEASLSGADAKGETRKNKKNTAGESQDEDSVLATQAVPYTQRGLTLARGVLRIDGGPPDFGLLESGHINNRRGFNIARRSLTVASGPNVTTTEDTFVDFGIGAGFGVLDNLEVGTLLLPLAFAPDGRDAFEDIEFYGRYRFVEGDIEVAGQLGMGLPLSSDEFRLGLGVPVLIHISPTARLDTGLEFEFEFYDDPTGAVASLDIPVAMNFMVTSNIFVGGRSGFYFRDFDTEQLLIPIGAQGGYTLDSGLMDFTGWLRFPGFLRPDAPTGADVVSLEEWQIGFGANLYMALLK